MKTIKCVSYEEATRLARVLQEAEDKARKEAKSVKKIKLRVDKEIYE